jgi:hypothetical protein
MREFEMPYAQLALFIVKALGVPGPYTLALSLAEGYQTFVL